MVLIRAPIFIGLNTTMQPQNNQSTPKFGLTIPIQPFKTPNFVLMEDSNRGSVSLNQVDAHTLSAMCDQFRKEIFQKAGKEDPVKTPR